jgi:hypothetical protein
VDEATRQQLYRAIVDLLQEHGFTTEHTYDLVHQAIDSVSVDVEGLDGED